MRLVACLTLVTLSSCLMPDEFHLGGSRSWTDVTAPNAFNSVDDNRLARNADTWGLGLGFTWYLGDVKDVLGGSSRAKRIATAIQENEELQAKEAAEEETRKKLDDVAHGLDVVKSKREGVSVETASGEPIFLETPWGRFTAGGTLLAGAAAALLLWLQRRRKAAQGEELNGQA